MSGVGWESTVGQGKGFEGIRIQALFGLNEEPFRANGAFFSGGGRQALLDELRHQVHFSERLLVLTGERGVGKTRLVRELIQREKDTLTILTLDADSTNQTQSMARTLCAQMARQRLGHRSQPEAETADAFLELAARQYEQGMRTLIVVDNAQQLSDEALKWLLVSIILPGHEHVGALLAGGSELVAILQRLPEPLVLAHVRQVLVQPLSQEDTRNYLEFRLSQAGWTGKPALTNEMVSKIHESSRGLPGRIAKLAPTILAGGTARSSQRAGLPGGRLIAGLALGVAIGAIAYVVWRYTDVQSANEEGSGYASQQTRAPDAERRAIEVPVEPLAATTRGPQEQDDATKSVQSGPDSDAQRRSDDSVALPPPQEAASEEVQTPSGEGRDPERPSLVQKGVADEVVPAAEPADPPDLGAVSQPEPRPEPGSPEWIRAQAPETVAIQLTGSVSRASAEAFAKKWASLGEVYVVRTQWKEKDWYVVLTGRYANKAQAREALKSLPGELKDAGAWIRTFASVQAALKE
ncbi:MAG: hypothetical protein D6758_14230 [Gammaproteobacteria bacterium]|nr:MAG: hypothetical protein D6758_14230 [Gammaproteobacteria bacterium]